MRKINISILLGLSLILTSFNSLNRSQNRPMTVVIDAGHGGKDPGAIGKYGTKEKDVVLDITKRVGRMLEKKTGIKVVYTRTEDVFIPLWRRTQIANEAGGKLFMSVHVNASPNRRIKGFETFLHSWDKTATAIDVAARENAVIKFEEKKVDYKKLSMERKITATMASSMFLKESEALKVQAADANELHLSLIHISEPTRLRRISYAVFWL